MGRRLLWHVPVAPTVRSRTTGRGFPFERVLKPFIVVAPVRTIYVDMLRMELLVREPKLEWRILRPGAIFHSAQITGYRTDDDVIAGRYMSLPGLVDRFLRQLDPGRPTHEIIAVATFAPPTHVSRHILE